MSVIRMKRESDNFLNKIFSGAFAARGADRKSSVGKGSWILIPAGVDNVSYTLSFPTAGSGSLETTTSSVAEVLADEAEADPWPFGTISVKKANSMDPVTAVRLVNASGNVQITMRAQ